MKAWCQCGVTDDSTVVEYIKNIYLYGLHEFELRSLDSRYFQTRKVAFSKPFFGFKNAVKLVTHLEATCRFQKGQHSGFDRNLATQ